MYFNYHAKAKKLIKQGQLQDVKFFTSYNNISPAMVLYFKQNNPMPIRDYKWKEYFNLISECYNNEFLNNKEEEE